MKRRMNQQYYNERTEAIVSESRENDMLLAQKPDKKGLKEARAAAKEAEEKKKSTRNTIIGGICSVVVLGLVLWNQGVFSKTVPAFTIDNQAYTANEVQMFYTQSLYSALMGQLLPGEGGEAYSFGTPAQDQLYSTSPNFVTWHEFFVQESVNSLAQIYAISEEAKASGFTIPEEGKEELAAITLQLDTGWVGYYANKAAYIRGAYGEEMTESRYLDLMEREVLANYYQQSIYDSFSFTSSDLDSYYTENQDELDVITFTQFQFSTQPLDLETDEDGLELAATEEQIAAFNADKEEMGLLADSLIEAVESGTSWDAIEAEFAPSASDYFVSQDWLATYLSSNADFGAWLLDEEREPLETTKTGSGVGYNATYVVTVYEDRTRADEITSNLHHIYWEVPTTDDEVVTEEDWLAAEEEATAWVENWISSGADLEEFANYAIANSKDTNTASVGGLMEHFSSFNSTTDTFTKDCVDWASNEERDSGDYTLIRNEEGTTPGISILYFENWNVSIWEVIAENSLLALSLEAWIEEIKDTFDSRLVYGEGMDSIEEVSLF